MNHGLTGYVKHKCRCDICKAAKKAAAAKSYQKHLEANRAKGRAYAKANPEAARARVAKWVAADPGRARKAGRERVRRYSDRNRERVRERNRQWRETNPDKAKASTHAYHRANPEKARTAAKLRRARLLGADLRVVTERDWRRLCERYDNRCAYCGTAGELEKDHVVPLTRGGRHAIGNLLPACKPCNSSKNHWTIVEWRSRARGSATRITKT